MLQACAAGSHFLILNKTISNPIQVNLYSDLAWNQISAQLLDLTSEHIEARQFIAETDFTKTGKVSFFDTSKGFGFIVDTNSQEKYFTHVSGLIDNIAENDMVSFELEKGMKGMNAVKVTLIK